MIDRETRELCGFCEGGWRFIHDAVRFQHRVRCTHCGGTGLQLTPEEWWKEVGHDF